VLHPRKVQAAGYYIHYKKNKHPILTAFGYNESVVLVFEVLTSRKWDEGQQI